MRVDFAESYLSTGANLVINTMSVEHLVQLASVARAAGGHLTIVGTMGIDHMMVVAEAGGRHVTFDTASYPAKD
jgi:D-arabinose 1-dehydrogenase-like Zn-dependent alcohol dehydrogenase